MDDFLPPESAYESAIPYPLQVKLRACDCMESLQGWCTRERAAHLIDLILTEKPQKIVEIGVFQGKSLIPMACALEANGSGLIFGIDPWNSQDAVAGSKSPVNRSFWIYMDLQKLLEGLRSKIEEFQLQERIILIQNTSAEAAPIRDIDLLHIDGNHSEAASYLDVTKWTPLVRSGGAIVFNDIDWRENGISTVSKAVRWLDEYCVRELTIENGSGSWAVWRKP